MKWSGPAADRISEAIETGELTQPGNLEGTRVDLDAYFATPEHLRMGYSVLAGAGFHPMEVDILRRMNQLEQDIATTEEPDLREELTMELNSLAARLNLKNVR